MTKDIYCYDYYYTKNKLVTTYQIYFTELGMLYKTNGEDDSEIEILSLVIEQHLPKNIDAKL